jgi:hypothetical protein
LFQEICPELNEGPGGPEIWHIARFGTLRDGVKAYNHLLVELIHHGKANPARIISHELPLAEHPPLTNTSTIAMTAGPTWSSIPMVKDVGKVSM